MSFRDLLLISVKSLRRGGSRSYLSILGIVIGIASVILILSISEAGQRLTVAIVQPEVDRRRDHLVRLEICDQLRFQ